MSTKKKLAPMWSVPRRVSTRKLNSYVLETLASVPLNGTFHARQLRAFEPREGTKLALSEAARREAIDEEGELEEGDDEVDVKCAPQNAEVGELDDGVGIEDPVDEVA
jgi:hypothetical protein